MSDSRPMRGASSAPEGLPLVGRTVVVTRARHQVRELASALEERGAEVLEFPVIKTLDPEDWAPADEAIVNLTVYDWVVFTSANAVHRFFERLALYDRDARALAGIRVAAVGRATADHLHGRGIRADYVPGDFRAEGLIEGFFDRGVGKNSRVLIPRALEAREVLPETLRERGARVDVVPVYRTVTGEGNPATLERMADGGIDVVTFTSPSTFRGFLTLIAGTAARDVLTAAALASIGPVTSDAVRELGSEVDIEADPYTVAGLVAAICRYFSAGECAGTGGDTGMSDGGARR